MTEQTPAVPVTVSRKFVPSKRTLAVAVAAVIGAAGFYVVSKFDDSNKLNEGAVPAETDTTDE